MHDVAIIGAGPAGLVAAVECERHGLRPVVFEAADRLGGLWKLPGGQVWPGMRANLSHATCAFPGFPWPDGAPLFPSHRDIEAYLNRYATRFRVAHRIAFGTAVTSVEPADRGWFVCAGSTRQHFARVIVASGFFSKPYLPAVPGREEFGGEVRHGARIADLAAYRGRRIVVVGNAFSGCDLAVALAAHGADVTHVFRRPYWILPRVFADGRALDAVLCRYPQASAAQSSAGTSPEPTFRQRHQKLAALCATQASVSPEWRVDPSSGEPPHTTVATGYLESLQAGTLRALRVETMRFTATGLLTDRAKVDGLDAVVFATGYETALPFLSRDVQQLIGYDPADRFMPVLLHQGVWPANLPGLSFVGMYRGPYFLAMALQARWVARGFANAAYLPSPHETRLGVEQARLLRNAVCREQFPYGDYGAFVALLAQRSGSEVDPTRYAGQRILPDQYAV